MNTERKILIFLLREKMSDFRTKYEDIERIIEAARQCGKDDIKISNGHWNSFQKDKLEEKNENFISLEGLVKKLEEKKLEASASEKILEQIAALMKEISPPSMEEPDFLENQILKDLREKVKMSGLTWVTHIEYEDHDKDWTRLYRDDSVYFASKEEALAYIQEEEKRNELVSCQIRYF